MAYGPGGELEVEPELSAELDPELGAELVPELVDELAPDVGAEPVPELGANFELWLEFSAELELKLEELPGLPEEQVVLAPAQAPEQHVLQAAWDPTFTPPATHAAETQNRSFPVPS